MRLSADPLKLAKMSPDEIVEAIVARRVAIRAHRDAKLDDRCWLDDHAVWDLVEGSPADIFVPPSFDEGMRRCRDFYNHRRADAADAAPLDASPAGDDDLPDLTLPQLAQALAALQEAIKRHKSVKGRPLNLDDDRALYAALPEKIAPDFRLPPEPEFLGEAKSPHAGCPAFWRSHAACPAERHDMHRWGPCRKEER